MTVLHRTSVSAGEGIEFVLSDGSLDRHGTRINPKGWILDKFRGNPIALFGHSGGFPIGRWENVRIEGERLVGKLVLAVEGTSARIDELRRLVEQGILRAVSVGFSVLEYGQPGKSSYDYEKQELLECSLVSVGSNTNALAKARELNISDETLSFVFGEPADERRETARNPGKTAATPPANKGPKAMKKDLPTLIAEAESDLNVKRDKLAELNAAETPDTDAIDEMNGQVDAAQRLLASRQRSQELIGIDSKPIGIGHNGGPAIARQPLGYPRREVSGFDLIVRAMTVRGIAHFGPGNKTLERVLDERYPGHEATAIVTRADQTIGTTGTAGWASELVQQTWAGFLDALRGVAIYPQLRDAGVQYSFDGSGTVNLPSLTAGGAGGGFFAEGSPIRVGRITTAATTMTARSMGVIVPFSRKLAMQSTPSIESVVRQAIVDDSAAILDGLMLDATAGDTVRPAGLLNGVSAVASGYGGGDYRAVQEDFKALLAPFIAANAASSVTVVMNPAQGLNLALMDGPIGNPGWFRAISERVKILESTYATANRLIAIRNSDLATALGDAPQFDVSEQAVVHMEDTTPLEIVAGAPTTADPVRSFWQTGTIGVRMIADVSWKMRRSGMVQWIDTTTW